jgi:glucose-6-phosphate isomerase, archaeal
VSIILRSYKRYSCDLRWPATVNIVNNLVVQCVDLRGHYHRKRSHAETYQALSGRGLVLFERDDGTTRTAELAPGKVTYVPPFWAHRSVNTSDVPLVFLWTCSVEAGHDYEGLGGHGMRQVVVERNGVPSVEDRARAQAQASAERVQ